MPVEHRVCPPGTDLPFRSGSPFPMAKVPNVQNQKHAFAAPRQGRTRLQSLAGAQHLPTVNWLSKGGHLEITSSFWGGRSRISGTRGGVAEQIRAGRRKAVLKVRNERTREAARQLRGQEQEGLNLRRLWRLPPARLDLLWWGKTGAGREGDPSPGLYEMAAPLKQGVKRKSSAGDCLARVARGPRPR